jgi:hypothetical protein
MDCSSDLFGPPGEVVAVLAIVSWALLFVAVPAAFVVVAIIDWCQEESYPWTHWLGIAVMLSRYGLNVAWFTVMLSDPHGY